MASKVHRVRYYTPKPQSINCISFNKINKYLAVARCDASIEIWDVRYSPFLINFIPGVEEGSVEALGWVANRLLSTGLGGALIEWDLDKLCLKNTILLTGYAAWCLDVNTANTLLAVGTEQGYVNLYNVENNDIVYKKLFDKQEGRIMCCKFNSTGNILVTGSIDSIRVWNVETGHALSRMNASRRGKETIVWCLAVLSDNIVVSGDSHGRLTFWDSTLGDQIESHTTHKKDILALTVSDDEKSLYCCGVDPVIVNFVKVSNNTANGTEQWVKNVQRHIHEHDVRGLIMNGESLISVGADGYLTFSSYPPKWVMRIPPMVPAPRSSICRQKRLLLLRYNDHLEVWKLGSFMTNENGSVMICQNNFAQNNGDTNKENGQTLEEDSTIDVINNIVKKSHKQSLKLTEHPTKLVSVQTKGKKQIKYCDLSPTGEFIAYSTDSDLRMLKLETEDDLNNLSLSKVLINGIPGPCDRLAFTEDSRTMVIHCGGTLYVLHVDPEAGATITQSIYCDKYFKSKSILHLYISEKCTSEATYLVVADTQGTIVVWSLNVKKFEHYINLPTYKCLPSALTVDSKTANLIITYVDQKIVEYNLTQKKFTEWPGSALPPEWLTRKAAVASITAHPKRDAVVFQDETSLWVMEKKPKGNKFGLESKKRRNSGDKNVGLTVIPIKYLAGFHWIGEDEAVTLEVLPENIVSQLPPPLAIKRHNMA